MAHIGGGLSHKSPELGSSTQHLACLDGTVQNAFSIFLLHITSFSISMAEEIPNVNFVMSVSSQLGSLVPMVWVTFKRNIPHPLPTYLLLLLHM